MLFPRKRDEKKSGNDGGDMQLTLSTNHPPLSLSPSAEKLYNSNGRDLRRALFSLKQIFQVKLYFTLNVVNTAGYINSVV